MAVHIGTGEVVGVFAVVGVFVATVVGVLVGIGVFVAVTPGDKVAVAVGGVVGVAVAVATGKVGVGGEVGVLVGVGVGVLVGVVVGVMVAVGIGVCVGVGVTEFIIKLISQVSPPTQEVALGLLSGAVGALALFSLFAIQIELKPKKNTTITSPIAINFFDNTVCLI